MGIWDKDKELGRRLDSVFSLGDYLILYALEPAGEVPTDLGTARKTRVIAAPKSDPTDKQEVFTLGSAIADRAALATDADFPVVVQLLQVNSKKGNPALVLNYVEDFGGTTVGAAASADADADIPY